jgi:hypothetical protein
MALLHSTCEYRGFEFLDWQPAFEAAIRENDHNQCGEELQKAKAAIFSRLKALATHPPGIVERIALNDAIHLLRVLRSENSRVADSHLELPRRIDDR